MVKLKQYDDSGTEQGMTGLKRLIWSLAALLLCAAVCFAEAALPLSAGDHGDDVLAVKRRLRALNYIRTDQLTRQYTQDTADRISRFQQLNGLEVTGAVDEKTWNALFSEDAVRAPWPTMRPLASPAPTPAPDWPERDAEGYLAKDGEYFYENDAEGLWIYLSCDLQITIVRREDSEAKLEWFETEIWTRNGETLQTAVADPENPGRGFLKPDVFAREQGFVLAFSDDFYANRINKKETVGLIIRDGRVLSTRTNSKTGHHLPNLDMMAQYPDGRLEVYDCNERTADELLAEGAVNVFSFGPWLIRDGEINELVYQYFKSLEPRHALGMIAPGHYLLLSVQGRTRDSEGTTLQRVAEMMKERGAAQAFNLDGGNTMALVFHGKLLNDLAIYNNKKFVRAVPSLIGVGRTRAD